VSEGVPGEPYNAKPCELATTTLAVGKQPQFSKILQLKSSKFKAPVVMQFEEWHGRLAREPRAGDT
jgi:hypothetical protein